MMPKNMQPKPLITRSEPDTSNPMMTIQSVSYDLPPNDQDAEVSVLASMLNDQTGEAFADVGGWLKGSHFYNSANGTIYDAAFAIGTANGRIDLVTVKSHLRDHGRLEGVGGPEYLAMLHGAAPARAHLVEHALIVVKKAKGRAFIGRCQKAAAEGYVAADIDEWSASALADLGKIEADGTSEVGTTGSEAVAAMMHVLRNPDKSPSIGTGDKALDRTIGKLRQGHLIVVASYSGCGKSAWAANVVAHTLLDERVEDMPCGVLMFSLEMKAPEITLRLACSRARLDSTRVEGDGEPLTVDDWRAFTVAANSVSVPHLRIVDDADVTIAQIRSQARRCAAAFRRAKTPLRLVVIDYAQIISSGGKRSGSREEEVAAIGREAKKLAAELSVPVILLSQLNADGVKEKRAPTVGDMRESKALLNDANVAFVIHNPGVAERAESNKGAFAPDTADNVEFKIGKRRGGQPCTVRALYWPTYTLFGSLPG